MSVSVFHVLIVLIQNAGGVFRLAWHNQDVIAPMSSKLFFLFLMLLIVRVFCLM